MIYLTAYLAGIVAMLALFALRNNADDIRMPFILSLFWPLSIILAIVVLSLDALNLDIRTTKSGKDWGFRKPTNPAVKGFAVAAFGTELQIVKKA